MTATTQCQKNTLQVAQRRKSKEFCHLDTAQLIFFVIVVNFLVYIFWRCGLFCCQGNKYFFSEASSTSGS